ncbi:hypothetical protein [Halocynthiibacter styelae]|uniref:Uncharacterized protein n=1 Tax=Halocynthiibacter styelae TaxID=2761955 RepID=A0A8J7LK04_9RHOB|nr:hypothetical protein [Paenihalocynthiibacter styelae]MBI1492935.1 hypothetical protein [Paenihalocynthiibacter styelae]
MESDAHTPGGFLSPELAHLVEIAPETFPASRPDSLEVCTFCCMSEEREAEILRQPRMDVSTQMLEDWLGSAFGDNPDGKTTFLWLLPAIARSLAQGEDPLACGIPLAFARASRTDWPIHSWTTPQQNWIQSFATHLLNARCEYARPEIDGFSCMFAMAGMPVGTLVNCIKTIPLDRFAIAIARDMELREDMGSSPFWEDEIAPHEAFTKAISEWFESEDLKGHVITLMDGDISDELLEALWLYPWKTGHYYDKA